MKLSKLLFVSFASLAIAGCDMPWSKKEEPKAKEYELNPTITGGSEEEKTAILEVLNTKPICEKMGQSTSEIFYDANPTLLEDEGDTVRLTNSYTYKGKEVKIDWNIPTQEYFKEILQPTTDSAHKFIEINYKGYGHDELGALNWSIAKLTCGEAVAANPEVSYSVKIQNEKIKHENVTIADCYAFTEGLKEVKVGEETYKWPATFDLIDYDQKNDAGIPNPYFIRNDTTNPDAKYYYVNVKGKVIYLAPDGKFGLMANGEDVLQIYAGSGTLLLESNFPHLGLGKYVSVSGNLSQYCGNVQLAFVTKIQPTTSEDIIEPSEAYHEITKDQIASFATFEDHAQKQAFMLDGAHMYNSLRKVTGTVDKSTLKMCTGKAENASDWKTATSMSDKSKRYMFDIKVGTGSDQATFSVYFDKHVAVGAGASVFTKLANAFNSGTVTVEGFATYFGQDSNPFTLYKNYSPLGSLGHWTIVPIK